MDKAKERKEARTIRMYEAERAKYEAERAKYEAEYSAEKPNVLWKGFRLGNLFELSAKHVIKTPLKNLHVHDEYHDGMVGNVTASEKNNGIVGYIEENEEISDKKVKNIMTLGRVGNVGICFYHKNYIVSTGNSKIIEVTSPELKKVLDKNDYIYLYLAKMITKIFYNTFYGFNRVLTENDFNREIFLLPCLEVSENDEYIWEENGRYYTLATNYISYLYLTGKVNKYQKLIDTYTYTY